MQQSQKSDKKLNRTKMRTDSKTGDGKHGGEEVTACGENESNQKTIIEHLSQLSKEFKSLKEEMRRDLNAFKCEVLKTMKDDFAEFKDGVVRELQTQNASITEAQSRIADLESTCLEFKDALVATLRQSIEMKDKMTDLESRSRRNNLRIYGVPEDKEGKSVTDFVNELLSEQLELPPGMDLQIQRAHRALAPKPSAGSAPRSLIVNFLQYHVKELVLQKGWQKKIELDGRRIYFDNDYAADVLEKRKAYGPIKSVLREKGIRFQTPYTKMRIHWESGQRSYENAEEAAEDLNRRGFQVTVKAKSPNAMKIMEERLGELLSWKTISTSDKAAHRARERLLEFRRDSQPGE